MSGDVMNDLNTPLLNMVNRKLVETHIDCADPFKESNTAPEAETATTTTVPELTETSTLTSDMTLCDVESLTESTTKATTMATDMTAETAEALVDNEIAATKDPETTTTQVAEEIVDSTSAAAATASNQQTSTSTERLPIKRRNKKPDSPYRPPKEEREL
jgi:hypothetical protein